MAENIETSEDPTHNQDLQTELENLKTQYVNTFATWVKNGLNKESTAKEKAKVIPRYEVQLCQIFNKHGWMTKSLVGTGGVSATFYLIKNVLPVETQVDLLPVIAIAVRKGEIEKNEDYASFLDRLRLHAGLKQLFGTQVSIWGDFLMLEPLQSESKVDNWRSLYNMPPMSEYISSLQRTYQMPLIRSPIPPPSPAPLPVRHSLSGRISASALGLEVSDSDVIRVDSRLVDLNVSVLRQDFTAFEGMLDRSDFRVYEDDHEQEVSFFSRSEAPLDIALVLDFSGSTKNKIGVIRRSVRRFIEGKKLKDRMSIVTFSDDVHIVVPLTRDKDELVKGSATIKGSGGSLVWDALQFSINNVFELKNPENKKVVVLMTDGADNALMYQPGFGSKVLFADLLENVRSGSAVVISIYLDTEGDDQTSRRVYRDARNTLSILAEESGGVMHKARRLSDLDGVFEKILGDLNKIYSIGYKPANEKLDGAWRRIRVETPRRKEIIVRTRSGYYAK